MKSRNGKTPGSVVMSAEPAPSTLSQEGSEAEAVADDALLSRPDPEVLEQPTRRHYSARYKLKILEQTDGLAEGQIGAYLRREGLYWSMLSTWRRQREEGGLAGLEPRKRGRVEAPAASPDARRIHELERDVAKLQERLGQALLVLDVQKKVLSLCESAPLNERASRNF